MGNNRITSKDIAKYAHVSQATVSYVLNDTPGKTISEETRKKIKEAVLTLGYTPNTAAKRLRTSESKCIAVRLTMNLFLPRYHLMLQGIRSYLEPRGYSILLCSDHKEGEFPAYITACLNTQADGILYVASNEEKIPEEVATIVEKHEIPISAVDLLDESVICSNVRYDYFATSYDRADRLIKEGFKNIIYIRSNVDNLKQEIREKGIKAAVYSVPGISLEIIRIDFHLPGQKEAAFERTERSITSSPEIIHKLNTIVSGASPDTCFICMSREVQAVINTFLHYEYLKNPSVQPEDWYRRSLSYHFDHFNAGFEAARSLLSEIRNHDEPRLFHIKPVIDLPNPEL